MQNAVFSEELVNTTKAYFLKKYGVEENDSETIIFLDSLSELFLYFTNTKTGFYSKSTDRFSGGELE